MNTPSHLVLLPCHSIYKSSKLDPHDPQSWHLAPFQIEANDHLTFIQHIVKAFAVYNDNQTTAALVISGGMTKDDAGEVSESASYFRCAEVLGLKANRVILEEYARDSFENLLFSLCAFKEKYGVYPQRVSIIGFEFKRERFVNYHAKSLKLPYIEYFGIDPSPEYELGSPEHETYFKELHEAEWKFSVSLFKDDLLGNGVKLKGKKLSRDPFKRGDGGYSTRHPELVKFFQERDISFTTTEGFEVPW